MSEKNTIKPASRELSVIEAELDAALKFATKNKIRIGGLLVEAKETMAHGEWLPWLGNNFDLSERSAQHYMAASKWAAKYENLADSKLHLTGIYALEKYDEGTVVHILEVAKTKWLSGEGVDRVAQEFQQSESAGRDAERREAARRSEQRGNTITAEQHQDEASWGARAPAEGVAPDAPHPVGAPLAPLVPLPIDAVLIDQFQQAISILKGLETKPAAKFVSADCSIAELELVSSFLHRVALSKADQPPRSIKLVDLK